MKSLKLLIAIVASLLLMSSCETTKQISYFQDLQQMQDTVFVQVQSPEIRLRPDDKISIIVNTKDPELTALFNLPYTARILGQTHEVLGNTNQGTSGYIIKGDGTIDFPVLGSIRLPARPAMNLLPILRTNSSTANKSRTLWSRWSS